MSRYTDDLLRQVENLRRSNPTSDFIRAVCFSVEVVLMRAQSERIDSVTIRNVIDALNAAVAGETAEDSPSAIVTNPRRRPKETPEPRDDQLTVDQWLAIRKEAALRIDPASAEVFWDWGNVADPYGVCPDAEVECIGRLYWARSPGSKIWVCFYDLPDKTRDELWDRIKKGLTRFPEVDFS